MPYIYTDKHRVYLGRKVPSGTFIENPENNRLLGSFKIRDLLKAGVAKKISNAEADKLRAELKKLEEDAKRARESGKEERTKSETKREPKPTPGGDS